MKGLFDERKRHSCPWPTRIDAVFHRNCQGASRRVRAEMFPGGKAAASVRMSQKLSKKHTKTAPKGPLKTRKIPVFSHFDSVCVIAHTMKFETACLRNRPPPDSAKFDIFSRFGIRFCHQTGFGKGQRKVQPGVPPGVSRGSDPRNTPGFAFSRVKYATKTTLLFRFGPSFLN